MGTREKQGGLIAGIILIIVGIAILLANFGLLGPEFFIIVLGVAFLVAYIFRRVIGFLIPGMILLWLGAAILLVDSGVLAVEDEGSIILISLGLAFVSIYIFMGRKRHWWPLIPGGILLILGTAILLATENLIPLTTLQIFNLILPITLILLGIWLIFRRFSRRQ